MLDVLFLHITYVDYYMYLRDDSPAGCVMRCCICKSDVGYVQVGDANPCKAAAHICTSFLSKSGSDSFALEA